MEVPEKLYIHKSQYWGLMANKDNITKNGIEYIRKNTFIDKVLKYLDVNFYFNNSRYSIECRVFDSKEEMFEDFKKYMKGE